MPQRVGLLGVTQSSLGTHRFERAPLARDRAPAPGDPPARKTCALGAKLAARRLAAPARRVESALVQFPGGHASIIPGKRAVGEDLIVLVSLPREQHDVAGARLV